MLTEASRNCFFINPYSVSEGDIAPQQARNASGVSRSVVSALLTIKRGLIAGM
jgi:hypothetical protein